MKWIVCWLVLLCLGLSPYSFGQNSLLQVTASHQQDTSRAFSGVDGLDVQRLETKFNMPLLARETHTGDWFCAAQFSENRFVLSGSDNDTRRLYRFSMPIEYETQPSGRLQHFWRFAPSYYSDESLIDQNRYVNELGWKLKYEANRKVKWVAGLRKDSRFGVTTMYPVFGLESQPNSRVFHHWVFPDLYSQMAMSRGNILRVFIEPNGGNWRYRQADGTKASFGMTDWNVGAAWFKPLRFPLQLKLEAGFNIEGEGSIAGSDGSLANGYFFLVSLQSQFPQ